MDVDSIDSLSLLAYITPASKPRAVLNERRFKSINALPPASRLRELVKTANTFASSGKNVFVHFTKPILDRRRASLSESDTSKKKYYKSAAQLWTSLDDEERFFWIEIIAQKLRLSLKNGTVSHEECLIQAGRVNDRTACLWHAELAVSEYLGTPPPPPPRPLAEAEALSIEEKAPHRTAIGTIEVAPSAEDDSGILARLGTLPMQAMEEKETPPPSVDNSEVAPSAEDKPNPPKLLDTLPTPFDWTPNILYSHFARDDLDDLRRAEGKAQTAQLRRLAERFDRTGKELFYYYMVPRVCKEYFPPRNGNTMMTLVADVWRFLPGVQHELWRSAGAMVKQQLGDGDVEGLGWLRLESLDVEVLRLHEMASEALVSHRERKM